MNRILEAKASLQSQTHDRILSAFLKLQNKRAPGSYPNNTKEYQEGMASGTISNICQSA